MTRELTGRHAFLIFASFFAVIIVVNIALAVSAVRTFPGIEVRNGYVASQSFEERRSAQQALGWRMSAEAAAGRLYLTLTDVAGNPVVPDDLSVRVGRPTSRADDVTPRMAFSAGRHSATLDVAPGRWTIWVTATAPDGTAFAQRLPLTVRE